VNRFRQRADAATLTPHSLKSFDPGDQSMRTIMFAASLAVLGACGQPPAVIESPTVETSTPTPTPGASAGVDGWEIDMTAYSQIGAMLPAFSVKQPDGKDATAEALRGHWTILGVWPATGAPKDEDTFAAALSSAVDQDPDLDLLIVHPKAEGSTPAQAAPWPSAYDDDGSLTRDLALPSLPAYLLVGPDLTVEGYRGALTATPDDGIKSVIRGVAEIRKQIAAPE
jgi:hypothetical protein